MCEAAIKSRERVNVDDAFGSRNLFVSLSNLKGNGLKKKKKEKAKNNLRMNNDARGKHSTKISLRNQNRLGNWKMIDKWQKVRWRKRFWE